MAHLIDSDRSHDKMWEAVFERVRNLGGRGSPWEAVLSDWTDLSDRSVLSNQRAWSPMDSHGLPQNHQISNFRQQ